MGKQQISVGFEINEIVNLTEQAKQEGRTRSQHVRHLVLDKIQGGGHLSPISKVLKDDSTHTPADFSNKEVE